MLTRDDTKELSKGYDIVIDVAVEGKSRDVRFYPMNETLEGEVRQEHLNMRNIPGAIAQMGGVIPGQRLYIDSKNKHVKVIDRKSLPDFKSALETARRISHTDDYRQAKFNSVKPDVDVVVTDKEWPTWLWHLRVRIDAKKFRLVKGKLPELDEIRQMGVIQLYSDHGVPAKDPKRPFWELHPEPVEAK